MLAWSPILIQKIEIHALGFVLRKLQLNKHRETEVSIHSHPYNQLILYLAGEGVQVLRERRISAQAGDLFVIPPNIDHGFALAGASRPLCLVLDYESNRPSTRVQHRHMPRQVLNELNTLLARVPTKGHPALSDYPTILSVIALLLEAPHPNTRPAATREHVPLVERVRESLRSDKSFAVIAQESGYVRDALSRRLKREHGLGLRALRDQGRLQAAQNALREAGDVGKAATRAGFEDASYFTRWFRKQTGLTPSAWRQQ